MADDLIRLMEQQKRDALHERGWRQRGGKLGGQQLWADPHSGALIAEDELFDRLDRENDSLKGAKL